MCVGLLRSCASLEVGQNQVLAEKQSHGWHPDEGSVVDGASSISHILESLLGCSMC